MKTAEDILYKNVGSANSYWSKNVTKSMKEYGNQFIDLIFIGKQKELYNQLFYEPSIPTKQIAERTGIESRNVSTQLNQMCRTGLVGFQQIGKLKYWHRML